MKNEWLLTMKNTFPKFTITMEHNFNPNKGDYKYILEEERRKQNREAITEPEKLQKKASLLDRFRNYILLLLFRKSSSHRKVKVSVPLFIQLFC